MDCKTNYKYHLSIRHNRSVSFCEFGARTHSNTWNLRHCHWQFVNVAQTKLFDLLTIGKRIFRRHQRRIYEIGWPNRRNIVQMYKTRSVIISMVKIDDSSGNIYQKWFAFVYIYELWRKWESWIIVCWFCQMVLM